MTHTVVDYRNGELNGFGKLKRSVLIWGGVKVFSWVAWHRTAYVSGKLRASCLAWLRLVPYNVKPKIGGHNVKL